MIARAAMWNCSIFCKNGVLSLDDAIVDYLKYVTVLILLPEKSSHWKIILHVCYLFLGNYV